MRSLTALFENNRAWAAGRLRHDPEFFSRLLSQQRVAHLWIGCSDSRVPANEIVGMAPGELFVHRNVANLVVQTDLNCLSVLQYAVEVLRVEHVIVCGHYGCGGIQAAYRGERLGLIDNWLRPVRFLREGAAEQLEALPTEAERHDRLCDLNVIEQVANVCRTTILQDAWLRSQPVAVHGLVYELDDGLLRDLGMSVAKANEVAERYARARGRVIGRQAEE
ncbi:MAG: carbonate dehydratase [Planctomycetes bacterium]|nr:carbonate dehydratase [Planctomycetota bacterium]